MLLLSHLEPHDIVHFAYTIKLAARAADVLLEGAGFGTR